MAPSLPGCKERPLVWRLEPSVCLYIFGRGRVLCGPLSARQVIPGSHVELTRINYRQCAGKPYRFVFGAGSGAINGRVDFIDNLVKIDLAAGAILTWHIDGCYPGEPVFVAAPEAKEEDEGLILSVVLDARKGHSFLLVLDASTWEERARAKVPHPIPFGFHGNFFAGLSGPESFFHIHR